MTHFVDCVISGDPGAVFRPVGVAEVADVIVYSPPVSGGAAGISSLPPFVGNLGERKLSNATGAETYSDPEPRK
jgi:hypothetical protein